MRILPKEPRQTKAIPVGHIEVDQDQVWPVYDGRSQPRLGVVSRPHPRAEPFKHLLCAGENGEVVVHNQDQDPPKGFRAKRGGVWGRAGIWHCPLGIEPMRCEELSHGGWPG